MNEVQLRIAKLQEKGWTLAAIAAGVGVTTNAVEKWKYGDRRPRVIKALIVLLDQLIVQKQVLKKHRFVEVSIKKKVSLHE